MDIKNRLLLGKRAVRAMNFITNGNFVNGTTGWDDSSATHSVSNNILTLTGNGSASYIRTSKDTEYKPPLNAKVFVRARMRCTNAVASNIYIMLRDEMSTVLGNVGGISSPVQNQWYVVSEFLTMPQLANNLRIYPYTTFVDSATQNGKIVELQEVMCIDMTAHGLDSLTADEMNSLFPVWFGGETTVLVVG